MMRVQVPWPSENITILQSIAPQMGEAIYEDQGSQCNVVATPSHKNNFESVVFLMYFVYVCIIS